MTLPSKPGQRCRVVGGRQQTNGEGESANMNRIVETVSLHSQRAGTPENSFAVWKCKSMDGLPLTTYYGAGPEADFLAIWLEVIPPETLPPTHAEVRKAVKA
jgi:hypothetical protein